MLEHFVTSLGLEIRNHVLVTDEGRRLGKDISARRMIIVIVTVENISNRHVEAFIELGFEPFCEFQINRIRQYDAFVRDQKDGPVCVVDSAVEIARDIDDLADRLLCRRCGR